ncbi:PREDICTED: proline-rich protein 2-like [Myotis brandtii]|uniref:proline-rich protein 2-like n=1 Tax=Myotis brandtii TaxID=109478 RepID=UPI0007044047|nr:PREDICTED: proline-rich protein 2-like [Myotis brandtii]
MRFPHRPWVPRLREHLTSLEPHWESPYGPPEPTSCCPKHKSDSGPKSRGSLALTSTPPNISPTPPTSGATQASLSRRLRADTRKTGPEHALRLGPWNRGPDPEEERRPPAALAQEWLLPRGAGRRAGDAPRTPRSHLDSRLETRVGGSTQGSGSPRGAPPPAQPTSPRATLSLPEHRPPHQTPPAADRQKKEREGRRGKCQRNPEGRKLDRQTEADPGFTVPERQPPDPRPPGARSSQRPGEKGEATRSLLRPNPSSPGTEGVSGKQEPEPPFSSHIPLGPGRGHFPSAAQGHLQGTLMAPPPPPSQTHTAKNSRLGRLLQAQPLLPPGSAWGQR